MSAILLAVIDASADTSMQFTDVIVHEGHPLVAQTPAGNRLIGVDFLPKVTNAQILEMAEAVLESHGRRPEGSQSAAEILAERALKEAYDFEYFPEGGPGIKMRLRLTVVRMRSGGQYAAVIRRIPHQIPRFPDLFNHQKAKSLISGSGLVLITGPTKNGKSTLAASILQEIRDTRQGHIITIEDPIEYKIENSADCMVTSREVGYDVKSFRVGAEDALRMSPNVILIGEIRDADTAAAALNLGESGHLVISTMQSKTAEGAIFKLGALLANQAGVLESISSSIKAVIRTALVPSKENTHYVPAYEVFFNEGAYAETVKEGNHLKIRDLMRKRELPGLARTLNESLEELVSKGLISVQTAKEHSNDIQTLQC